MIATAFEPCAMIDSADLDHILIFSACFISLLLLVSRSLTVLGTVGAFAAAAIFVTADGHFLLGAITVPGKNPQIATVVFYLLALAGLISAACVKRWRSFDRLITAITMASIGITGLLFHYLLIQQVLPAWSMDAAWGNSHLLPVGEGQFEKECASARLQCWALEEVNGSWTPALPYSIAQQVEGLRTFYAENPPEHQVGHGFGAFNDLEPEGVTVVLYYQDGDHIRLISDPAAGERIHGQIRTGFYLLSSVAHGVWLFGALWLIAFHRARFKKKAQPC